MLSLGEQSTTDTAQERSGYRLLDMTEHSLDPVAAHRSDDSSRLRRPLKAIFAGLLAIVICVLTLQNLSNGLAILHDPFDRFDAATQKLITQSRTETATVLSALAEELSTTPGFETAVSTYDMTKAANLAAHVFVNFNGNSGKYDLTVYNADQSALYLSTQAPAARTTPGHTVETDLAASLADDTTGLEYAANGNLTISALRRLIIEGELRGYLKLSTDIEPALALMSSTVDSRLLKVGGPVVTAHAGSSQNAAASKDPIQFAGQPPLSQKVVQDILEGRAEASWLAPLVIDTNRVLIAQPLSLDIVNGTDGSRVFFIHDITASTSAFIKTLAVSILVCVTFTLLAWLGLQKLLHRMQQTIRKTQNSLEAEVSSYTRELERSQSQLLEAQAIASIGSWEGDLETREIFGSQEFFRILGIPRTTSPSDVLQRLFDRIPAPELSRVQSLIKSAIEHCHDFDLEHSIQRPDGTTARIHTKAHIVGGPDGRAVRSVGTVHDITERSNTERQNKLMAKILETSLNEIYVLNADTFEIEYANTCALKNLGCTLEDLKGCRLWDINLEFDQNTVANKLSGLIDGSQSDFTAETYQRRKDGTDYPVDFQIQLVLDQNRYRFVAMANDISERVQRENETRDAKERAERLAYFDPLTKLSNRAGCQRDALERFAGADLPAFLIHVDMDNFKRVNDTLGHLAGDYCLAETGRRLREVSRSLGTPYRWGGDEFVIIANSSSADPNELCERARRLMRAPMEYNGTTFWPTVSMGIALCPEHGTDFDTLLVNADLALYRSKHTGKDRFTFFSSDLQTLSDKEAQMERELHMAAQRDEFFLVFQPQVNMRSHKVVGMEALVRWQHPERGIVSPGEFLPVVEKTGFASVLGEIVLDKAFAAARAWQDAGLDFGRISVNVSPAHLSSGMLLEQFKSALGRYQLAPDRVTAEVLESVFLDDHKSCHLSTLKDLHEMGVHVELDDFGTGYASLTHVVDLPINGLKIDRSFTRQLLEDSRKEVVINQIIHLARSLDLSVICEGVETEEQYDRLRMMGDFAVQGFLIAKPLRFEDATNWMSETVEDLYFVF